MTKNLCHLNKWALTDSNRRPSACKADALNQLSYAPLLGGMTRLERATPWSQTKYTTNCTTSRFSSAQKSSPLKSSAKVRLLFELAK